ncbi:MAG: hypothetical protein AB7G11_10100 [Phycisphaerales bacterium]
MRRERLVQLGALGSMLGCMLGSIVLTTNLSASAGRHRLVFTDRAEEGDPPEVALGIAMGAFRGLFVNILWMRANDRKDEGRFYDAVDIARTITKLQPRFPRVWAFHAWNLAYNISVTTSTPQERWNWVNQGIRLLRDEGIPANPNDLLLHKELGWIYLHKIQGYMDDANQFYKRQFAKEWSIVLGAPPRRTKDFLSTEARLKQLKDWLQPVLEAPDTLDAVYEKESTARAYVDRMKTEGGLDLTGPLFDDRGQGPGEQMLLLVEHAKRLSRMPATLQQQVKFDARDIAVMRIFGTKELNPGRNLVIAYTRKKILRDKYHMSPQIMVRTMDRFGPLDWRHPASHALYWSDKGTTEALSRISEENRRDFDFLNADRQTLHAIQELFRTGDMVFDVTNPNEYLTMPSVDFIPAYEKAMDFYRERGFIYDSKGRQFNAEDTAKRIYTSYSAGYENFMKDAVRYLYRRGDMKRAQEYFEKVRDYNKMNVNNPGRAEGFAMTLKEFVDNEIAADDRIGVPDVAKTEIMGALQSAYGIGLLNGDSDRFRSEMNYARDFHEAYMKKQLTNVAVNQGEQGRMEIIPRDFREAAGSVLASMIVALGFPDGPTMYQNAPADLQAWTYFYLEPSVYRQELGDQFAVSFPEPPDYAVYKADMQRQIAERKRNLGDIEKK